LKFVISLLLLSTTIQAKTLRFVRVTKDMAFADNGRVYDIAESEVVHAKRAAKLNMPVEVDVINSVMVRPKIERVEVLNFKSETPVPTKPTVPTEKPVIDPLNNYKVSVLSSMDSAHSYFNTMDDSARKKSQCFNRAYVWSWRFHHSYGLNAGKLWLFFTERYIRNYNYHWWFHIAPYFHVAGQTEEIMFDREFDPQPKPYSVWKQDYIYSGAACPVVKKYTDFSKNQEAQDCYVMKSSMYYWQPEDLEKLEAEGVEKKALDSDTYEAANYQAFTCRGWRRCD